MWRSAVLPVLSICAALAVSALILALAGYDLGAAYGAQGKLDEAIAAWQTAVRLDPDSAAGRMARANIEIARAARIAR